MEQQNKYRVIVSARAAQMLVSHAAFLAQVSPAAAERLTVEFEKAAKSLEQMPQRCPWLKGEYIPKNAYRFILFEKRYIRARVISRISSCPFSSPALMTSSTRKCAFAMFWRACSSNFRS